MYLVGEGAGTTAQHPAGIPVTAILSSSIVLAIALLIIAAILIILVVCRVKNKLPSKTQNFVEVELKINKHAEM